MNDVKSIVILSLMGGLVLALVTTSAGIPELITSILRIPMVLVHTVSGRTGGKATNK